MTGHFKPILYTHKTPPSPSDCLWECTPPPHPTPSAHATSTPTYSSINQNCDPHNTDIMPSKCSGDKYLQEWSLTKVSLNLLSDIWLKHWVSSRIFLPQEIWCRDCEAACHWSSHRDAQSSVGLNSSHTQSSVGLDSSCSDLHARKETRKWADGLKLLLSNLSQRSEACKGDTICSGPAFKMNMGVLVKSVIVPKFFITFVFSLHCLAIQAKWLELAAGKENACSQSPTPCIQWRHLVVVSFLYTS